MPTTATPASVLALDPPVPPTLSVLSLKLLENNVLTVAPEIEPLTESSLIDVKVALPVATGASFNGVTVRLMVSELMENEVVPPVPGMAAVPPLLPVMMPSQALTVRAIGKVPFQFAVVGLK